MPIVIIFNHVAINFCVKKKIKQAFRNKSYFELEEYTNRFSENDTK